MKQKERAEKIDDILKRFKNKREWLIIRITKMDNKTTTPLAGILVDHDVDRDTIFQRSIHTKGMIQVRCSDERLPKGYAYAL